MDKKNIIVIGSSGHAKVVISILELNINYTIVGLIDTFKNVDDIFLGYKILGKETDIPELMLKYNISGGIIAIGNNWHRKKMAETILKNNPSFKFITAIHPKAIIHQNTVEIGNGTTIMAGAIINPSAKIGHHCIINTGSVVEHDCNIANYASLAPGVVLGGSVQIAELSAIGIHSTLQQGVSIGAECIIGAHAFVNRNIPACEVWYGVPAKFIKKNSPIINYLSTQKND